MSVRACCVLGEQGQVQLATTATEQEVYNAGVWQFQFAVCSGTCGSNHKWAATLAEAATNFTITKA